MPTLTEAFNPGNSIPGVYNFTPLSLVRWRKALARVRDGSGRAKLAFIGDSTTAGLLSNGTSTNIRPKSAPYALAPRFANVGASALIDSTWGDAGGAASSSTLPTLDSRVTFGAGWAGTGPFSLGGAMPANSTTTNVLAFTPAGSFDAIDIYYVQNAGLATFTVNVDAGATLATINAAGSIAVVKSTVSCTAGTHTVNIARNGTGSVAFIIGIDCYLSTAPKVAIWNMGACGSTTANWATNTLAYDPLKAIVTVAPDLVVLNLGINDARTGVSVATYQANMQAIITAISAASDIVLQVPVPSDTAITAQATTDAYKAAVLTLGAANNLPVIDVGYRFVRYSTANTNGLMADSLHPGMLGYQDIAAAHYGVLCHPSL